MHLPSQGQRHRRAAAPHRALTALAATLLLGLACAQVPPPLEELFSNLSAALEGAPKADFDVTAALAALGTPGEVTPEAVFEFVRDDIGLVAYRGALKGASGVLMDRAGNALDRTLLLKAMLEANGNRAIVAHATLSAAQAEQVVAALRGAPTADATLEEGSTERLASLYGLDPADVTARFAPFAAGGAALERSIEERTNYQSAALGAALEAAGQADALNVQGTGAAEAVADHWWVQVETSAGWLDLDPTLPGAAAGSSVAAAELRFDLTSLALLAAVDGACRDLSCGDRLHRVHVTVVAETWDGEALTETELAATDLLSAEGAGRAVAFAAIPTDWPGPDLYAEPQAAAAYRDALLATTEWRPTLFVDDAAYNEIGVSADGTVGKKSQGGGAAGNAGMLGGGIGGMFGGFGGAAAGDTEEEAGAFTALWLDYTVTAAGAFQTTHRREVFDLLGPAARAAGVTSVTLSDEQRLERAAALSGQSEIVVVGAGLPATALQAAAAGRLLDQRGAWEAAYDLGGPLPPSMLNELLSGTARLVTPLERFEQLRAASGAVQTAPLVVAYHRSLGPDLTLRSAIDIVSSAQGPSADAASRLVNGVRDTVTEAVLQEHLADPAAPAAGQAAVSVAYAADLVAGRPWQVVGNAAELSATAPDLPADLRARVLADLAAGRLAVVPQGGAQAVGWWSLDPATGAVLGIGDRGWGQAMSEYVEQTNIVLQLRTVLNQYASMGRCLGMTISLPLQGYSDEAHDALNECLFTTICSGVNTGLGMFPSVDDWTSTITMATIDALWGGVPETGYGGFCGALFKLL